MNCRATISKWSNHGGSLLERVSGELGPLSSVPSRPTREKAFKQLGGESARQLAEEQYDRGSHRHRNHPRQVKLVGDPVRGRIVLVDVQETNGHTSNGRSEKDMADGLVMPL
ncbi:MAG: hypothetical protein ACRELF_00865 [Gemmataceae bacterium]